MQNTDEITPVFRTANIGKTKFTDGTEYIRMPNGNLVRSSRRAFEIRKSIKKSIKSAKKLIAGK